VDAETLCFVPSSSIPGRAGTYPDATHSTSIPPHSNTRNNVRSDPRTASTPTTSVQNVAPSSAVARAAAAAQRLTSSGRTPQKSMKTRVTTSGAGEMCCHVHLRRLFVRCLRDETQGDVFVLE
jgi:hypothetical protein